MNVNQYISENNSDMTLNEVFNIINTNKPFEALQRLNVELFKHPHQIYYGCAEQVIDNQTYCFRFTPNKIFVSKRKAKKVTKMISERFSKHHYNHIETASKERKTSLNQFKSLKRVLGFKQRIKNSENGKLSDKERYFISDMLHEYRTAFDGKFNTCCQKRLISNMEKSQKHALSFFSIAYQEMKKRFKK